MAEQNWPFMWLDGREPFFILCIKSTLPATVSFMKKKILNYVNNVETFWAEYTYLLSSDLMPGWDWLGRRVDTADYEWKTWTPILLHWLKFVIAHLIVNQFLRQQMPHFVPICSLAVSFAWLWASLGLPVTLVLFLQPVIFIMIYQLISIQAVWAVCLVVTLTLHSSYSTDFKVQYNCASIKSFFIATVYKTIITDFYSDRL